MQCHEARNRLAKYHWRAAEFSGDKELLAHLESCVACRSLVLAEQAVANDIASVRQDMPETELDFAKIRNAAEAKSEMIRRAAADGKSGAVLNFLLGKKRYRLAIGLAVVVFGFLGFVPFNFQERAGYEIAIAGVDKTIAEDNTEITSLFCALGMEEEKTSALHDSLDVKEIRLNVGECRETCYLTICDLKTEKDVAFVVNKIIELGCCQIDKIAPVFRNESSSLLKHIAKKMWS